MLAENRIIVNYQSYILTINLTKFRGRVILLN